MNKLYCVAGVVVLVAAAFVGGRFSAPLKTEIKEVEKVVYKDRIIEKRVEVAVAAKVETRIIYRDKVVKPDGTVTEHTEEHEGIKTDTHSEVLATRVEIREVEKLVEVEKRVTLRPDWRIGILAGASLQEPVFKLAGPLILGASIDRRVFGGFSIGVWGTTTGAFGGVLSFEF